MFVHVIMRKLPCACVCVRVCVCVSDTLTLGGHVKKTTQSLASHTS